MFKSLAAFELKLDRLSAEEYQLGMSVILIAVIYQCDMVESNCNKPTFRYFYLISLSLSSIDIYVISFVSLLFLYLNLCL